MIKHLKKIRERIKNRNTYQVDELEPVKCENCSHEFKGHFCPACGQEVAEFNRPFGFIFYDFMGNFFAFDTRFYRTFWQLLFRPGFLTVEFFKGKRVRYSPPFRIFIFLSFVLFLLLEIITQHGINQILTADADKIDLAISGDSLKQETKMLLKSEENLTEEKDSIKEEDEEEGFSSKSLKASDIRDALMKEADRLEKNLPEITDPEKRKEQMTHIQMFRNPELVVTKALKYLSWAFFILLPAFALILKFFYIRRKQLFIRHLFFSIHLHSYLFFILILVFLLNFLFESGTDLISLLLLIAFPVYFILALRKFYRQSWGKTIFKFLAISFVYNIVLLTTAGIVIAKALGLT